MIDPFWLWVREHKWMLLLFGTIALVVISPVSEIYDRQDNVISPLTAILLWAVTFGASESRQTVLTFSALILVWLIISIMTDGSGLFTSQTLIAPILFMVLLLAVFIQLARWLIRAVHINTEVLCAAICGYLLIGILWTCLYAVLISTDKNALVSASGAKVALGDLLYFSYTTLTTTGFGDILPKNPVVRMLTVLEAIVGIFYNTIVIARFVGLYGIKISGPGAPSN